jgi:hypothetical protein
VGESGCWWKIKKLRKEGELWRKALYLCTLWITSLNCIDPHALFPLLLFCVVLPVYPCNSHTGRAVRVVSGVVFTTSGGTGVGVIWTGYTPTKS